MESPVCQASKSTGAILRRWRLPCSPHSYLIFPKTQEQVLAGSREQHGGLQPMPWTVFVPVPLNPSQWLSKPAALLEIRLGLNKVRLQASKKDACPLMHPHSSHQEARSRALFYSILTYQWAFLSPAFITTYLGALKYFKYPRRTSRAYILATCLELDFYITMFLSSSFHSHPSFRRLFSFSLWQRQ